MISSFVFIGIDPGVSGAIAIVTDLGQRVFDIPLLPKTGKFNRHDSAQMWNIIYPLIGSNAIATIEHVRFDSRDNSHKGSAETLVRTHESWVSLLAIAGIETHDLEVIHWRKASGCPGLTDDALIVAEAIKRYPSLSSQLKRRSTRAKAGYVYEHNRAEALLIADAGKAIALGALQKCS
jgi:hypothetical protein